MALPSPPTGLSPCPDDVSNNIKFIDIPTTYLTLLQHQLTRGNQMKYYQPHTRVTAYQQFFFLASIKLWNLGPADIVSRPTIDAVRRGLALSPGSSTSVNRRMFSAAQLIRALFLVTSLCMRTRSSGLKIF